MARGNGVRAFGKQLEIIREALAGEDWVELLKEADPSTEETVGVAVCYTAMTFAVVVFIVIIVVIIGVGGSENGDDEGKEEDEVERLAAHTD